MKVLLAKKVNGNHTAVLCKLPKNDNVLKTVYKHFNHGYMLANPDEHKCGSAWDCVGCPASNVLAINHCGGTIVQVIAKEFLLFDRKE
jgi:hypothetical protein